MSQDDDSGENICRSSSLMITSTTTVAVKRTDKSDGGVAHPPEKNTAQGRPERPHCGTCRMYISEDSGGHFGGYSRPDREV